MTAQIQLVHPKAPSDRFLRRRPMPLPIKERESSGKRPAHNSKMTQKGQRRLHRLRLSSQNELQIAEPVLLQNGRVVLDGVSIEIMFSEELTNCFPRPLALNALPNVLQQVVPLRLCPILYFVFRRFARRIVTDSLCSNL